MLLEEKVARVVWKVAYFSNKIAKLATLHLQAQQLRRSTGGWSASLSTLHTSDLEDGSATGTEQAIACLIKVVEACQYIYYLYKLLFVIVNANTLCRVYSLLFLLKVLFKSHFTQNYISLSSFKRKQLSHFKGCALLSSHLSTAYIIAAASFQKSDHYIPKKEITIIYSSRGITVNLIIVTFLK